MTGANYLLEHGGIKILVDCGLFQGFKYAEVLNYEKFAYNPAEIDYVFITHSHTDHIGRLPKLYKEGFRGKVYVVEPTKELMLRAFPDNWSHMAEEAKNDKHDPLYSVEDIENVMQLTERVPYHQVIKLTDQGRSGDSFVRSNSNKTMSPESPSRLTATFLDAGHILGSAIVCFEWEDSRFDLSADPRSNLPETHRIYFTGDLGNSPSLLLPDKEFVRDADYVVVESAYGGRIHEDRQERAKILEKVLKYVIKNKGTLMIPSFAIERTQEILFELHQLFAQEKAPMIPVFIDSPLANKMTDVYNLFSSYLNSEARSHLEEKGGLFNFSCVRQTNTIEESKKINETPAPKIIIAGSGMSSGGRILHHEKRYLSDPNSAIVFVGYQVEGSLGRKILDSSTGSLQVGHKEVTIFGEPVPVRCLVKGIGAYSAHADQPALVEWVKQANQENKLKKVFVVQGEEESAKALAGKIESEIKVEAVAPNNGEVYEIT